MRLIFLIWRPVGGSIVGGGAGYAIKKATEVPIIYSYWLALFIGIASVVIMRLILNSLLGLGLAAIRDNDNSAASSGVNVFRLKLYSFVISGVVTGLAGAAFYIFQGYVDPENVYSIRWTIAIMLSTVLGGINTEEGPIVGAAIVVFLYFMLAKYAGVSLLIQGIILTGIMLLAPHGIMGALRRTRPYQTLLRLANGDRVL
jgi:branched-chain amino acid transport system permease protein